MAKKNAEAEATETTATETVAATETVNQTEGTEKKSIVPSKYAGKYKNGGSDDLARFIKQEAGEGDKFSFDSFFALCRKNGIADEQVNKYQDQVSQNAHGAKGRARMTLRNMLATLARKNGKLIKLDGTEDAVTVAKPAVSGAAAAAQANAEAPTADPAPETAEQTADEGGY
jgi:hypothetical protein